MPSFDADAISKKYNIGQSDWLNLQQGVNKIRIVSPFLDYGSHFNPTERKSLVCIGKDKGCPECAKGNTPRVQFLGWVIDRNDNKVKLLRIGYQIYKAISDLANSEEYGFESVPSYDITINKSGEGLDTEYSVIAARNNTELTDEEKTEVAEKCQSSPQDIIDKMRAKVIPESDDN